MRSPFPPIVTRQLLQIAPEFTEVHKQHVQTIIDDATATYVDFTDIKTPTGRLEAGTLIWWPGRLSYDSGETWWVRYYKLVVPIIADPDATIFFAIESGLKSGEFSKVPGHDDPITLVQTKDGIYMVPVYNSGLSDFNAVLFVMAERPDDLDEFVESILDSYK